MKPKLLVVLSILLVLGLVITGCSSTPDPEPTEKPAATPVPVATEVPEAPEVEPIKVALVVNQLFGDKGPSDDLKAGLERAAEDFGVEIKALESPSPAEQEENLRAMAADGYDLIIATFPPMGDALQSVARDYPETKFLGIWIFAEEPLPNLRTVEYKGYRVCYLLGAAAAKMTQTGKLGRILGADSADLNPNYWAFVAGAQQVTPDIEVQIGYTNSYEDPEKGKELGLLMYSSGVDVIMTDASRSGLGVIEAAKETGNYIISDPVCHPELAADLYITGLDLGWAESVYVTVRDVVDGEFEGGHIVADFIRGGQINISYCSFDSFRENGAPEMVANLDEAEAIVLELADKIESGELTVPYNEASGETVGH